MKKQEFNWDQLHRYLDANPYMRFSISCYRGGAGERTWQAVIFKETGAIVARGREGDRVEALLAMMKELKACR